MNFRSFSTVLQDMLASLVSVRERRVSKQSRVCVCVVEMFGPDLLTAHWSSSSRSEPSRGGGTCCTADLPLVYCKYHTRVGWGRKGKTFNTHFHYIMMPCIQGSVSQTSIQHIVPYKWERSPGKKADMGSYLKAGRVTGYVQVFDGDLSVVSHRLSTERAWRHISTKDNMRALVRAHVTN